MGKTIINHLFGNGLYWFMKLFYPHAYKYLWGNRVFLFRLIVLELYHRFHHSYAVVV